MKTRCLPKLPEYRPVCPLVREGEKGTGKGFIFSSDQVAPHQSEIQVWSSMQTNFMSSSCTNKQGRFRPVRAVWCLVRLHFNPVLKQCFVELFRRSAQEQMISRSNTYSSSMALDRTQGLPQLYYSLRPR